MLAQGSTTTKNTQLTMLVHEYYSTKKHLPKPI